MPVTVAVPLAEPLPMKVVEDVLTLPPLSTFIVPVPPIPIVSADEVKEPPVLTFKVAALEEPRSIALETLAPSAMVKFAAPPLPMVIFVTLVHDEPAPVAVTLPVVPAATPSTPPTLLTIPPLEMVMLPTLPPETPN